MLLDDGANPWKKIFCGDRKYDGIEIEQERYAEPLTPMQSIDRGLQNFRRIHG